MSLSVPLDRPPDARTPRRFLRRFPRLLWPCALPLLVACSHPYYVRADVYALGATATTSAPPRGELTRSGLRTIDGTRVADAEDTGPLDVSGLPGGLDATPLADARVTWTPLFEGVPAGAALALPADPARGRYHWKARGDADGPLTAIRVRIEAPGRRPVEAEIPAGAHAYEEWCLIGVLEPDP